MENEFSIPINLLQHYIFCPRQWGLMELDNEWRENHFVTLGNRVHKKVDNPFFNEKRKNLYISRSVPIFSETYGLNGIADLMEFNLSDAGAYIDKFGGKYDISLVEYKRGKPRVSGEINYADKIQITAQMMCLNEMFSTQCSGYVYYDTIGRRVKHKDYEKTKEVVLATITEMRGYIKSGTIPPLSCGGKCRGCSLYDVCLPKLQVKSDTRKTIKSIWVKRDEKTT